MVRRALAILLLGAAFAAPAVARAQPRVPLLPGVTYEKGVQFTPHGAVVIHVITAPRPGSANGLYGLGAVLARNSIMGGRARVTQIEKDVSTSATVAGINGDRFSAADGAPSGIYVDRGVLAHTPSPGRSSIAFDSTGALRVDRVRLFGTWKGTGQRRPVTGINEPPRGGEVILFTPAWGAATPRVANAAEVVLQPFPAATPNADLTATVTATPAPGGGTAIPPDGAVLMAAGASAAKLQAEAPVGTAVTTRLILQPDWTGVVDALGGGPLLVRDGKPVFRSLEDFTTDQLAPRDPRAAVGQLADGRIVLVAVDGRQPGYSVGMTSFELAQTLVRLGAVTGAGLDGGGSVTVAFDGQLLNRPSDGAERAVKEALLVEYYGVYAPPPPVAILDAAAAAEGEPLQYKLVRPSTVTAQLVAPDGTATTVDAGEGKVPGWYRFRVPVEIEGTWRWIVSATDDLGRASTIERTFSYNTTLADVRAPSAKLGKPVPIRVTLARPARVVVRLETRTGVVLATTSPVDLAAGDAIVAARFRKKPFPGRYVAHVFATNEVGKMDLAAPFTVRR